MKIGTNKRFTKFAHRDPNPGIPFVDPYPPQGWRLADCDGNLHHCHQKDNPADAFA